MPSESTIIFTNSSASHIEESQSFYDSITKTGKPVFIFITDNGTHNVRLISLKKIFNTINVFKLFSAIRAIKRNNVSKVIITAPIPLLIFLAPYLKYKSIKVFYTLHEPPIKNRRGLYYRINNIFHYLFLKFVDVIFFYSEYSRKTFSNSQYSFTGELFVLPLYKFKEKLDKVVNFSNRKNISFIGNMGSNKDISYVLNIAKKIPEVSFIIAGNGDISSYKEEIERIDNLVLINRHLSYKEYYSYIDDSLFVLLPYSSASQSGVMLDIMCRGSVPVVTRTGAFEESIQHGSNGFMFNYETYCDDFISLYQTIEKSDIEVVSNNSLQYYNDNFSFDVFHSKFLSIYEHV